MMDLHSRQLNSLKNYHFIGIEEDNFDQNLANLRAPEGVLI